MSLSEIFSDSIKYPFSDFTKFVIVGVLALLASFSSVVVSFGIDNTAVSLFAALVSFVFAIILGGYCISVMKAAIEGSDIIPDIDFKTNLIDGIMTLIIGIVYFLIPIIIAIILLFLTGAIGAGLDHVVAALGIGGIIAFIIFLAFAIFEMVALARYAKTKELGDALNIGEVIEDVKRIGILQIIAFLIISLIIIIIAFIVSAFISMIPYIGIVIASLLVGAFTALFYYRALGLLYASA
jgi:hypothetical protein